MTLNPYYGKVFYNLGMECKSKCSLDKQLSYFQKAVFYDPLLNDAYEQMGVIYGKQGQIEKEFAAYRKAAALDHINVPVYFKVGLYYFQKGELAHALRYFLQSDRYGSRDDRVYYIASIYDHQKMYKEAISHYRTLILRESPLSASACKQIWRISKVPGQYEMALSEVYQIHSWEERRKLWEKIDRYLRTDQVPEFMQKSKEEGDAIN